MQRLFPLVAVLALGFASGCSFDSSALDDRPPCDSDDDCTPGICIAGSCFGATSVDDSGGDTGSDLGDASPDARTDTSDGGDVGPDAEECEPGRLRCNDNAIEECSAAGDGFDVIEECGEDRCIGNQCIEAVCEPGESFCAGDTLVRCADDGIPIVEADCPSSAAYCSEEPNAHCEPRVCSPFTSRCTSDATGIEVCDARGTAWAVDRECGDGFMCDTGECVELDCEPGSQRCVGPFVYATCDESGSSSVLTTCTENTYCLEGSEGASCAPQDCPPGGRRCASGEEVVEVCDERGTGFSLRIECESSQYCLEGICTARVCEPNTVLCAGDFSFVTCDARGSSGVMEICTAGTYCDDATGSAICTAQDCTPGTRRCRAATLAEICNSAGSGFTDTELCTEGDACDSGACTTVICTPDAFECPTEASSRVCNEVGTRWTNIACAPTEFCSLDASACTPRVCEPSALSCDGDSVVECNSIGSGTELVEECEFGCAAGECAGGICGDGVVGEGEECDDGNDNPCDWCDDCQRRRAATISPTSVTTSSVVWQPNTADFTIEAWIQVTSESGALFGLGERTGTDYAWVGVVDGTLSFEYALASGVVVRVASTTRLAGTGWHHVVVERFDLWGAAIFIDGRIDGFIHDRLGSNSINFPTRIWVGSEGTTTPISGNIDELRISNERRYNTRFTPQRHATADGTTIALYRFNGTASNVLEDASGNGRNLSASNIGRAAEACYGAPAGSRDCGDGGLATWEECDDGNSTVGDGCSPQCVAERCRTDELRGPNDQCYHLSTTARTWGSAGSVCRGRGTNSNLVTVNDAVENDWIAFFMDLSIAHWIGLTDDGIGNEGDFRWASGSSSYRNWAPGEPNNNTDWDGDEDCVVMLGSASGASTGQWNDDNCGQSRRAICERTP